MLLLRSQCSARSSRRTSRTAVAMRDRRWLSHATPGVGPKVAERIVPVSRTRRRLVRISTRGDPLHPALLDDKRAPQPIADAVSALVNLGYGQPQARRRHRRRKPGSRRGGGDRQTNPAWVEGTLSK